jgi:hypothetical protein
LVNGVEIPGTARRSRKPLEGCEHGPGHRTRCAGKALRCVRVRDQLPCRSGCVDAVGRLQGGGLSGTVRGHAGDGRIRKGQEGWRAPEWQSAADLRS